MDSLSMTEIAPIQLIEVASTIRLETGETNLSPAQNEIAPTEVTEIASIIPLKGTDPITEEKKSADNKERRPSQVKPSLKSILKKVTRNSTAPPPRRLSTVQDQTLYNALAGKVENLDQVLAQVDEGLIDISSPAHKQIVQELARRAQEDPPRYAIKSIYNEHLPCLKKITEHYHRIAVGASTKHPSLIACDARLQWANEYVNKMNDMI